MIKDFISKSKCDKAIQEIDRLVDEFEPTPENITIFGGDTSQSQASKHLFSKYFMDSSDKVSFFF